MKKFFIAVLILLVLAGGAAYFAFRTVAGYVNTPVGVAVDNFQPKPGASLLGVLDQLQSEGVIAKPKWVYYWARANKLPGLVKTGAYAVKAEQSPLEILAMLAEGRVKTESFTLAEGLNRWDVRKFLDERKWVPAADFDRMCDDKAFLAKYSIPGPTCDGYLYPETYNFARGVSAETVMATLFKSWQKNFTEATANGTGPRSMAPREFMTLASIVEKETGVGGDRPHVACVFYNRLAATPPWTLATDPTVIYAATLVDPTFDGNIKKVHLQLDHPYNTYRVKGLPPGPISSPGRASMDAVATPLACKDYFFVATNDGHTLFCPTLDCHEKAVQKWQVQYFQQKKRGKH